MNEQAKIYQQLDQIYRMLKHLIIWNKVEMNLNVWRHLPEKDRKKQIRPNILPLIEQLPDIRDILKEKT